MTNATIADLNVMRLTGVSPQERTPEPVGTRTDPGGGSNASPHSFTHALADAHASSAADSGSDTGKRNDIGNRTAADPKTDAVAAAAADPAQDSGKPASAASGDDSSTQSGDPAGDPATTAGASAGASTGVAAKPAGSGRTAADPGKKPSPAEELLADIEAAGTAATSSPDGAPAATTGPSKDPSLPARGTTLPPDGSALPATTALAATIGPVPPQVLGGSAGLPADDQKSALAGAPATGATTAISSAAPLSATGVAAPVTGTDSGVASASQGQAIAPSAGGTAAPHSEAADSGAGNLSVAGTAAEVQDTSTNAGVQLAGSLEKFSKLLDAAGLSSTTDSGTGTGTGANAGNAAGVAVPVANSQTLPVVPQSAPGTAPGADLPPLRPAAGSPAWAQSLGERMVMMTDQGLQQATLRMDPEHLGPVQVHIQMDDGNAQVWFSAHHSETRAALEDAIPRLRELFSDQGLNLSQANVDSGRGTFGQRGMPWEAPGGSFGAGTDAASREPEVRTTTWQVVGSSPGRIDLLV